MKKSYVMWNTVGSIYYSFCQWIITILVVHIAAYEAAGYLSLAMTMSSSFSAISLFSMRNYQISDVKGEFETSQYISSRVWTSLVAFIACAIVAMSGNSTYQMLCIDAFMLIRIAEAITDVMHGVNQKYNRYDYIGISYILRGTVTVIGFSVLLYICRNLTITLFAVAGMNLLLSVGYDCTRTFSLEKYRIRLNEGRIKTLLIQCIPLVVFTFLLSLENLIPKNVLQYYYGTESLGIYSSIASPTLIVQVFASVVFSPFLPQLAQVYNEGEIVRFKAGLRKVYLFIAVVCVVVVIGAMILGRWGLSLLFGAGILEYYELFMPIVLCTLFTGFCWIISAIVIMLREIKKLLIAIIVDFALCVALVVPIVRTVGQNGVSIVQLITLPLLILMMIGICEWNCKKADGK